MAILSMEEIKRRRLERERRVKAGLGTGVYSGGRERDPERFVPPTPVPAFTAKPLTPKPPVVAEAIPQTALDVRSPQAVGATPQAELAASVSPAELQMMRQEAGASYRGTPDKGLTTRPVAQQMMRQFNTLASEYMTNRPSPIKSEEEYNQVMDDLKSDFQYSGMVDREIEEYGKSQIMPPNVKREIAERESREREEKKARTELDQQTARDVELTKRRKETTGETVGAYIGGRWEVPPTPPTPELTAQEKVAQGAPEGYETYYNVEKQRYEARPPGEAKAIPPEEVIQPRAGREFIPAIPKGQREVEIAPTPPALEVGNESWKLFANINPVKAEASLFDMYSSIQKRDIAIARVDTLNAAEVKDKGAIVEAEEEVSTAQIEFDAKSRASGITEAELMQYLRKKAGMPEPPPTPGKPPEMSDEEWNLRQNVTLENLAETQAELAKIQLVAPVATEPTREELEAEMRRRGLL